MHFAQHWILSWFLAEADGELNLRERRLVTIAGLAPDLDALPYAAAALGNCARACTAAPQGVPAMADLGEAWRQAFETVHLRVHHHYTHGIGFVALMGVLGYVLTRTSAQRSRPTAPRAVGLLAAAAAALHCLCDVIASGPRWPIYPLWPVSDIAWGYPWSWTLADWPNVLILLALLAVARQYAKVRGRSPLEVASARLDARFVALIRGRAA